MSFIHLHTHSMYSLRDSIIRPEELVERLKELNHNAVAITDHGECLGSIHLYKKLKEANIKYIHGCEMYICDDVSIKDKDSKYYHLVLLCKNEQGRLNLNKLISISEHPDNFYYRPRIDFNILSQYSEGLVGLSACMAGEISRLLENDNVSKAEETALKYKELFGNDYYLEIQSHSDSLQKSLNQKIYGLAQKIDIKCVITCDAHYVWKEDKKYQNKYAFNGKYKENGEAYIDCYLQSENDVRDILDDFSKEQIDEMITNIGEVNNKCNVIMPLSAPIMPQIDTPIEYGTNKEWLIKLCEEGFKTKLNINYSNPQNDKEKEYVDRFEYELDSLDRMGFIDYILLVYSYSNIAKRRGIARGSGGGSLICYLTNITNIDPIEHGLYFERFIDVGALDLLEKGEITKNELKIPDIDLDFSGDSCKQVLNFLYNRYGEDKVASIGRFGTNKTKGTIRDMCKVLDIDLSTADEIAKSFENYELEDIDLMINGEIPIIESAKSAIKYVNSYRELFDYVRKLNGLPKSFGLHPCGRVISTKELDYFTPSCYDSNGVRYLQGDMHAIEDVGLVKIDVLGLRTLDQEYDTIELSCEDIEYINPKQGFSDEKVLDIFRNGNTTGIFQMASYGMKETLKKMNVKGIDDISVANAIYRPGAMAYINNYCNRKAGKENFEYLHSDLEPILKNTYGIIIFQEQLIEIGRLAGLRNPDLLRKATGKKDIKLLNKIKPELEEKLKNRGWTDEQFEKLWADMIEFARYSFNKAHSSAYGIIAYMTAKQKAYYPKEFFAGLLNSYIGKSSFVKDDSSEIFEDMKKNKVQLSTLHFKKDHRRCNIENGKINYAIRLIKDCNESLGELLYSLKDKEYKSFIDVILDLLNNGCKKNQLSILIKLDFYSDFGNAKELLGILEVANFFKFGNAKSIKKEKLEDGELLNIVKKYSTDKNNKGEDLKSYTINDSKALLNECEKYIKSLNIEDFNIMEKIKCQQEYLGYMSTTGREEDRPILFVNRVYEARRKSDNHLFAYNVTAQSIGSGIETTYTVYTRTFKTCGEIKEKDIIKAIERPQKNQGGYFVLDNYRIL